MKIHNAGTVTLFEPEWDWGVKDSTSSENKQVLVYMGAYVMMLGSAALLITAGTFLPLVGVPVGISYVLGMVLFALGLKLSADIILREKAEYALCHEVDRIETLKRQEHWVNNVFTPYLKERYNLDLINLDYQNNGTRVKHNGEEIKVVFEGIEFIPNNKFDNIYGNYSNELYNVKITSSEISVEQVVRKTIEEE